MKQQKSQGVSKRNITQGRLKKIIEKMLVKNFEPNYYL